MARNCREKFAKSKTFANFVVCRKVHATGRLDAENRDVCKKAAKPGVLSHVAMPLNARAISAAWDSWGMGSGSPSSGRGIDGGHCLKNPPGILRQKSMYWWRLIDDLYGYCILEEPLLIVIDSAVNFMPLSARRNA